MSTGKGSYEYVEQTPYSPGGVQGLKESEFRSSPIRASNLEGDKYQTSASYYSASGNQGLKDSGVRAFSPTVGADKFASSYYSTGGVKDGLRTSQLIKDVKTANVGDEKTLTMLLERLEYLHSENKNLHDLLYSFTKDKNSLQHKDLMILELEAKRKAVENEYEKQQLLIEGLYREIDTWKLHSLECEKKLVTFTEAEARLLSLSSDHERLLILLRSKDEEIAKLNLQLSEKFVEHHTFKSQHSGLELKLKDGETEREHLTRIIQEKDRLYDALLAEKETYVVKLRGYESSDGEAYNMKREIEMLREDNEKFNEILTVKIRDLEAWRVKYATLEAQLQEIVELKEKLEAKDLQIVQLQETLASKETLILSYVKKEKERAEATYSLQDLEAKLKLLMKEIERLENELLGANKTIAELREANAELESKTSVVVQENERLELLIEEWKVHAEENKSFKEKLEELNSQLNGFSHGKLKFEGVIQELEKEKAELLAIKAQHEADTVVLNDLRDQLEVGKLEKIHFLERIEALGKDVEFWKVRTVELEKQLTDRLDLETKLRIIVGENERLSDVIEAEKAENDNLRARIESLEKEILEFAAFRTEHNLLLNEKRSLEALIDELNRRNSELQGLFVAEQKRVSEQRISEGEVHRLRADVQRLEQALQLKTTENSELRHTYQGTESQVMKIKDLERSLLAVSTENERLNALLSEKINELERTRERSWMLEKDSQKVGEMQYRYEARHKEIETLTLLVDAKQKEIDEFRWKYSELERSYLSLESKLPVILQENERLATLVEQKLKEIEQLNITIADHSMRLLKVSDIERKLELTSADNERLLLILNERLKDSEVWKSKVAELERGEYVVHDLHAKLQQSTAENQKLAALLKESRTDFSSHLERSRALEVELSKITDLQGKLTLLATENQHLNLMLSEQAKELMLVRRTSAEQIEALRAKIFELDGSKIDGEDWRLKYTRLSEQNQQLNLLLSEKAQEVATLRGRLEGGNEKLLETESLKKTLAFLSEENSKLTALVAELKSKGAEHDVKGQSLSGSNINVVLGENERLNGLLSKYLKESELLRREVETLRIQNSDTEKRLSLMIFENDRLRHLSSEKTLEAAQWMKKSYTLESSAHSPSKELKIIVEENERLNKLLEDTTQEKESWKRKYFESFVVNKSGVETKIV
mmetsp:Transcript_20104/g.23166  ORF Transcript_20104/g.23166 Transcript_20104/m.23166 type:complete len:1177 (-) Transcript_20104:274-3804(-)|eukprot:CAMPEP_0176458758 /NCGR_PEP_ID=MMETSP0127-20121128/32815_1 /TAXON_ID=938130 /ORGANISM="Platyophrya macrostoma, Strain WH" /LENGTH=1176 /DNA_ID=CAMNT_0017849451 /DNA_START=32 /DNA_END=3562 /DNA_ORIENTATION=+